MLCILGALCVSSAALPHMNQVSVITLNDRHCTLSIPIVGYKNNIYSDGKTILLHQSSIKSCCPIHTFKRWKRLTQSLRCGTRQCGLLFSLQRPISNLTANKCASILQHLVTDTNLDLSIFTA
ncbi:uncharacterized protein ACA1_274620 [Acanthamoeba castellanii str. Neff]|uniref:Uncharacterized protein n=1 Tax=Acanthamoeba castellanii (strain ATCC 30010 / Neff) TaxID=1257118 RepID=L8GFW0_ACACF|nr:uncharacterized protein ACA1_274620 [Acanthamoeba castellanii str. Neff]ELR11897.1 hypothetical protein ACA1_274620 [Acanthamoeba castellanii str. Neff]